MERPDRSEKDEAQKAKLIFFSLAALVLILLIWSFYTANIARREANSAKLERDQARQEIDAVKSENAKFVQSLNDQRRTNDELKNQLQLCESKLKAKPPAKKPSTSKKSTKTSSKAKKKAK